MSKHKKILIILVAVFLVLTIASFLFFGSTILYKKHFYSKVNKKIDLSSQSLSAEETVKLISMLPQVNKVVLSDEMYADYLDYFKNAFSSRDMSFTNYSNENQDFDSVKSFTVANEADIANLTKYTGLTSLDLSAVDYLNEGLKSYINTNSNVEFKFGNISSRDEEISKDKIGSLTADQIGIILYYLKGNKAVDLTESALSLEDFSKLKEYAGDSSYNYRLFIGDKEFDTGNTNDMTVLKEDGIDPEELANKLVLFDKLESLNLMDSGYSSEDISKIAAMNPELAIEYAASLFGVDVDLGSETLVLDGVEVTSLEEVKAIAAQMKNLKQIDMNDCGVSDEEMDEFRRQMSPVKVVWTVDLGKFKVRTDAKHFATWRTATDENGYIINARNIGHNTSESLEPLKYCTELEALDLGHNKIKDVTFLSGLTNLKYLVLSINEITDISPLSALTNLKYLEFFSNDISDISALSGMNQLQALCMSDTLCEDVSPLYGMDNLKMLYLQGYRFKGEVREEIARELPNCKVIYKVLGSSGSEWRQDNPYYREMRLALGWREDMVD